MWSGRWRRAWLHEVANGDALVTQLAGLEAHGVLVGDVELQGVLDRDDAVVEREKLDERVEEGRLAAAGPSGNQDVLAVEEGVADEIDLAVSE